MLYALVIVLDWVVGGDALPRPAPQAPSGSSGYQTTGGWTPVRPLPREGHIFCVQSSEITKARVCAKIWVVQNLENGANEKMERKFTTQEMANEVGSIVGDMATSSLNLVAAGAFLFAFGVYVDNAKAADVTATLHKACETLGYGKSSKYALAGAAVDVARRMVKDYGRPDATSPNSIWQELANADTPKDAIALVVADIRTTYGSQTVQQLYAAMKGDKAPATKTEKSTIEKVNKAMEGATGDETAKIAIAMQSAIQPSDAKLVLLNLAGKLTADELQEVLAHLTDMVLAKAEPLAAAA